MIRGVLLDVDGTLILSNDAHAHAWVDAFAAFGYDVAYETVRPLVGMGGDQLMPKVVPGLSADSSPGKDITSKRSEIFLQRYAPDLAPAPGSRALVERMQADGLQLVIASSSEPEELRVLLRIAEVDDLVQIQATGSDARSSKPSPDIVEVAMQKIGMPSGEVTMLGDTPFDVESAGKANVGLIALRCGGFPDSSFRGALAVYDDPADLLNQYDRSPLSRLQAS